MEKFLGNVDYIDKLVEAQKRGEIQNLSFFQKVEGNIEYIDIYFQPTKSILNFDQKINAKI